MFRYSAVKERRDSLDAARVTGATWLRRLTLLSVESLCVSPDPGHLTSGAPDHWSITHRHRPQPQPHTDKWFTANNCPKHDLLVEIRFNEILNLHRLQSKHTHTHKVLVFSVLQTVFTAAIPSTQTVINCVCLLWLVKGAPGGVSRETCAFPVKIH